MKWEMEMEQIEAVLERIWDLHDKISDAIHAISRAHFLKSIKNVTGTSPEKKHPPDGDDDRRCGYVFVKGFRADEGAALAEARSLNAIRSALENLEDQIEFFHTIQTQQQAERDGAIARVEQSRIILAMRLAEHKGEKHKVIEEAQAFVSDVQEDARFQQPISRPHAFMQMLVSSLAFAKKSLCLDRFGGALGNAALFAASVLALLHMHKLQAPRLPDRTCFKTHNARFQSVGLHHFDVYSARG